MSSTHATPAARRRRRSALSLLSIGVLATFALPGCGKGDKNYEITDVRTKKDAGPMAPETTLAQRLGAEHGAGNGAEAPGDGAGGRMWAYVTPPGWTVLPPAQMRDVGWGVAGNADAECTFSTLKGGGGGLVANVNRWRTQMSLPPLDDAAVQALPKKSLFGRPATFVELSGTYVGMGGSNGIEGAKLLGLIADLPMVSAFLKLKGPAAVVDAETAHFYELAASIGMRKAGDAAPHEPAAGPSVPEPAPDASAPFQWTAPEGWVKGPEKSMRLVTYLPAKAPKSSCYVSVLGGAAGGAKANIDRWADQMGLPPLSDDAFEKLDRKTILGKPAVFCALEGTFGGMSGGEKQSGWVMLGMVLERGEDVIFVKMTGPVDEIAGEKANFRAFCESFHE